MESILLLVNIVVAVLLVITVLLQRSESGMGAGLGGGPATADAGQTAQKPLVKATSILGAIFLANIVLIGMLNSRGTETTSVVDTAPQAEAPLVPSIPAPLETQE